MQKLSSTTRVTRMVTTTATKTVIPKVRLLAMMKAMTMEKRGTYLLRTSAPFMLHRPAGNIIARAVAASRGMTPKNFRHGKPRSAAIPLALDVIRSRLSPPPRDSVPSLPRGFGLQAIGSRLYLNHTLSPMVMYIPFHGFLRPNHGFLE